MKIKNQKLLDTGFILLNFPLDSIVLTLLLDENWKELDQYFLDISKKEGQLREFLLDFVEFETLEHIIAIRSAPDDEDGIWHDDGSRILGFSLSLNISPETITGGELRFKSKNSHDSEVFPPLPYGKVVLFLSGLSGYEHMVSVVTRGKRIVIAGWCS